MAGQTQTRHRELPALLGQQGQCGKAALTDGNPADSHGGSSRSKEDFLGHRNAQLDNYNIPTPSFMDELPWLVPQEIFLQHKSGPNSGENVNKLQEERQEQEKQVLLLGRGRSYSMKVDR